MEVEDDLKVLTAMSKEISIVSPTSSYTVPEDFIYEKGDGPRSKTVFNKDHMAFVTSKADLFGC